MRFSPLHAALVALAALLGSVAVGPSLGQTSLPRLAVSRHEIAVRNEALTWTPLDLSNSGDGQLTWTARVDRPWLKLAASEDRLPVDSLSGEGETVLLVRTVGRGKERGTYTGHLFVDGSGGADTVSVTLTVHIEPALDPGETRVDSAAVPPGVWSTPFAFPVEQVLARPLDEIVDQLRQQVGATLRDPRVVAVTSTRVLYLAAESRWNSTVETRVWTSADGGASWNLLLRRQPNIDCQYTNLLQSASLHPDGKRVFLGVTDGLFLDDRQITGPEGLTNIDALHVSPDGQYLYVATKPLPGVCFRPGPSSDAAVYRARLIEGSSRLEWDGGRSRLVAFVAPVAAIGSDPRNPDVVFLLAASGGRFRKLLGAAAYGWQELTADSLPPGVDFSRPSLSPAREFVRVPDTYVQKSVPYVIDLHNAWAGYLFGRDGIAYGRYTGFHGGMYFDSVIASRDGGISWSGVGGTSAYGTRPASVRFLDAHGFVAVSGHGSWTLDPIDPLTSFVFSGSGDILSRSTNGGRSWTAIGQGLPGARGAPRVALDSLGTLYARFRDDVFARPVAEHPLRVVQVLVEPDVLRRGDAAAVTARVSAWPRGSASPRQAEVRLQTEPDLTWVDLRDDGVPPDARPGDGLWTASITVPDHRPFGSYGAIVAAHTGEAMVTRASARGSYQVVPGGHLSVFGDRAGAGWTCSGSEGSADVVSSEHVHAGSRALRMAGDLTCTHAGSLHPFSRTLDLWAFSPTGTNSLRVEDADISGEGLPAGRWVHLSLPAEQLHEHPRSWLNGGPDDPEPVLITRLQFRAATPLWLDEIRLLGLVPDIPTAVGEATPPSRPRDSVLLPAYPNPFNAGTVIPFRLRRPGLTRLVLLDILGQRVRSLVNADLPAGDHSIAWDGRDDSGSALGTGVYLARLTVGTDVILFDKIMLVR